MNCAICGTVMDPVLAPATTHPNCLPFTAVNDDEDPAAARLKKQLIEIIQWYDNQNPRHHQVKLGPSDLGSPCDRRIGYRIAGIPPVNVEFDKWPANVGTAIHSWLEEAVSSWTKSTGDWITEKTLPLGDFIEGHADLYNRADAVVIDHKTAGPDIMKKIRKEGPPPEYVVQVHLYGLAYEMAGYPVSKVALAFYPRAGWLKDMYVWLADYDRPVAERAYQRPFQVAQRLVQLDIMNNPHRWQQIEAVPTNYCGMCPMYDPNRDKERGADDKGCPGRDQEN